MTRLRTLASHQRRSAVARRWCAVGWLVVLSMLVSPGTGFALQVAAGPTAEERAARYLGAGEHPEAEAIADSLLEIDPGSKMGWEIRAASRYLMDDRHGALRAWRHTGGPMVHEIEIEIHRPDRSGTRIENLDPMESTGIARGALLTVEGLVRGERRLNALPAVNRARLGYSMRGGGEADLSGVLILNEKHPFTRAEIAGHALRLLVGKVQLRSADPLGRLESWELVATAGRGRYAVTMSMSHPAPLGSGVWSWTLDRERGHRSTIGAPERVREERTGVAWGRSDWISARVRTSVQARYDHRQGIGGTPGVGGALTLLSLDERKAFEVGGTIWSRMGNRPGFSRFSLMGSRYPAVPASASAPSGVLLRFGVLALSSSAPSDLTPLFGSGSHADILLRARREVSRDGVIHPFLPASTWVHGGIEFLHSATTIGPVGVGFAVFADGAAILARRISSPVNSPRSSLALGFGGRARIAGIDGWLRIDWGIDPANGASALSAAWVRGGPS